MQSSPSRRPTSTADDLPNGTSNSTSDAPALPPPSSAAEAAPGSGSGSGSATGLWTDILRSADRQKALARKNVVLLSERHRGRALLLDKLVGKRRNANASANKENEGAALAIGYEVLEGGERDEGELSSELRTL
jgi:dynein light intermediate chain 1